MLAGKEVCLVPAMRTTVACVRHAMGAQLLKTARRDGVRELELRVSCCCSSFVNVRGDCPLPQRYLEVPRYFSKPSDISNIHKRLSRGIHKMHVNSGRGSTKPCNWRLTTSRQFRRSEACETCCAALSLSTLHWSIQPLLATTGPSSNVCSSHEKTPPPGQASPRFWQN